MIIAQAELADLAAIVDLENEGFEHSVWSEQAWRSEIEADDRHVLVARSGDGPVVGVATFQTVAEVADLHRVVVRADQRGRGIARRLLNAGLEWAEAMGAHELMLEVEIDNQPALRLYERYGFTPLARRDDYYGPGLHAVVMSRPLGARVRDAEQETP